MRAATLRAVGQPPRIETFPDPASPGRNEVLVEMKRAPINPADRLTIAGAYIAAAPAPCILGAEGVGAASAIGEGVERLKVGDHVLPLTRGNWASRRVLAETDLIRVSADFPIEQAAMLRINPATAWRLLHLAALQPDDWIIQNGAASSVAGLVRTFARARGVNVINVVRRQTALADDAIVLQDGPSLAGEAARASAGAPIKLALDCVAGESSGRLASCLAPDGQLVVFGHLSGAPCSIPSTLLTAQQLRVRGFSLRPAEANDTHGDLQALYDTLALNLMARQNWTPVSAVYPLEELDAALKASAQGGRFLLALDA